MFLRLWYQVRHRRLGMGQKVYIAVFIGIIAFCLWMLFGTGIIRENSFTLLHSPEACDLKKQAFSYAEVPRKPMSEVVDVDMLTPIRFQKDGEGNGLWGLMDVDGSVVVEGMFDKPKQFYGGFMEMRGSDYSYHYLDSSLTEVDITVAAPLYVEGRIVDKHWQKTKISTGRMLMLKENFPEEMIATLEENTGLQFDYMNIFSLPYRYYAVRFYSFEYPDVYGYYDENMNQIGDQLYFNEIYVEKTGIVKVDVGCGMGYLNPQGEILWYEDYVTVE